MRRMARTLVAILGFAVAMTATSPASAAYYIVYWSDYPGGTWVGYEFYCDGGNLIEVGGNPAAGNASGPHYVGPYPC